MLVALAFCVASFAVSPETEAIEQAIFEAGAHVFSGVVLIERDGDLVMHSAFGTSPEGSKIDLASKFYVASVSKTLTVAAALRLEERGVLDLDRPLSDLIDGVPDDKADITPRMLLTHTSGLVSSYPDPLAEIDRASLLAWAMDSELRFDPGSDWAYSNIGFNVVSMLLESATGQPFVEIVKREVFEPAGMETAEFTMDLTDEAPDVALGRGALVDEFGVDGDPRSYITSQLNIGPGGIVATASDLLAFDRALREGRLLTDESVQAMAEEVAPGRAMGWRAAQPYGLELLFHGGDYIGFDAVYARVPEVNGCIVVLSNCEGGVDLVQALALAALAESIEDDS